MTDEKFVKSIIPTALCTTLDKLDKSLFNVDATSGIKDAIFVVYAQDEHIPQRDYIVGMSMISETDIWTQIANALRRKMLARLEG